MSRLRSVVVVALIWMAAFAASSAPDGFGGASRAGATSVGGDPSPDGSIEGKRWAVSADPAGKRWDGFEDPVGKRWS
jgi:hypothetical protein